MCESFYTHLFWFDEYHLSDWILPLQASNRYDWKKANRKVTGLHIKNALALSSADQPHQFFLLCIKLGVWKETFLASRTRVKPDFYPQSLSLKPFSEKQQQKKGYV